MTQALQERHPSLMVPHVFTFGVVIYTNGSAPTWPSVALRDALIAACPPGTGVGEITCTSHGVYLEKDRP
jgi:hypothetical protein